MIPRHDRGFTLIEAMITAAILAILAAVALPSYQEHIRRTHRAHARATLVQAAQWMERAAIARGSYPSNANMVPLGVLAVEGGRYAAGFAPNTLSATTFTLQAVPVGAQAGDRCGTYTLTHTGLREQQSTPAVSTPDTPQNCWDR